MNDATAVRQEWVLKVDWNITEGGFESWPKVDSKNSLKVEQTWSRKVPKSYLKVVAKIGR